ncbi:hypothetical protein PF007_g27389 [Phytophthora fragariae]|uniref:Uncharacterized protein n=1 Tax=Phytophthora fragariae TaxID=53985 RepID=A0A6A3QHH3_9STRA|nr:hypothetical protein PF003_g34272 [Phytophthora fragariae]KAE8918370.1 hypothetical protein PF009_g31314 [Phytophthora fragariae]KAE9069256.1 hypothetical protein PF007_g27389 [Phytophthora fragariae]KAE9076431.1 hypothetical protein PF006_g28132 [Phytophthora fragariae]KAE9170588.1 hypothetical protein PF004_g27827 [Phytophthora fragariae]
MHDKKLENIPFNDSLKSPRSITAFTKCTCKCSLASKDVMRKFSGCSTAYSVPRKVAILFLERVAGQPVQTAPQIVRDGKYIGGYSCAPAARRASPNLCGRIWRLR